jgi:transposase, IS6 family
MVSTIRNADAAEPLLRKVLDARHTTLLRVITVEKNAAHPQAFEALQQESMLPELCQLRPCKYLNNKLE